jgi:outer membrane protein
MRSSDNVFQAASSPQRPSQANRSRFRLRAGNKFLELAFLFLILTGCVHIQSLTNETAPSPQVPWTPPPLAKQPVLTPPPLQIPPDLLSSKQNWTLVNLVDIGLSNNMQTRAAWGAARSAAAVLGVARSLYFPRIFVDLNAAKTKGSAFGGRFSYDYSNFSPTASLSYLLLDFGGRQAGIEEARQALAAANWTQNTAIQSVILQIEQNYYQYLTAKELLKAQEATLKEAEANLDAANQRHQAGVATVADVLQAKTALSRAQLDLISTQGLIQTFKGALANSTGLPANTSFEVADELPSSLPLEQVSGEVERFINEAQSKRPDLAAARSLVFRAEAHIRNVQSEGLPTLAASGSIGRVYYSTPASSSSLSAAVLLDIPLSRGFSNAYQVLQAKMDAETAQALLKKLEQDIVLQVWTGYYNTKTAAQRIKTAQDLYDTAQQSYQVSLAGYKAGVGSILDLLAAQSSLEGGRVQLVQAKTDWLLSLVQFAYDTGTLELPDKAPAGTVPRGTDKGDR